MDSDTIWVVTGEPVRQADGEGVRQRLGELQVVVAY